MAGMVNTGGVFLLINKGYFQGKFSRTEKTNNNFTRMYSGAAGMVN